MKQRGLIFTLFTVLSIIGYGVFVFAAPSIVYQPGEKINPGPGCLPNGDCVVDISGGGGDVTIGNPVISGTPGELLYVDGNGNIAGLSDGSSGQILQTDGSGGFTWVTPVVGSGSPAGFNSQIQFNNNGNFGASPNFGFSDGFTNAVLSLGSPTSKGTVQLFTPTGAMGTISFRAGGVDPVIAFPGDNGSSGDVLSTDGNGNLSWEAPSGGGGSDLWTLFGDNNLLDDRAGNDSMTGYHNIFLGYSAGISNVDGANNIFIGPVAGFFNTSGVSNLFFGQQAGYTNQIGSSSVIIGNFADVATSSTSGAVAIGHGSIADSGQFVAGSNVAPITDVYFGNGVSNAAPIAVTIHGTNGTSGVNGGDLILAAGDGGASPSGNLIFKTSTLGGLTERLRIDSTGKVGIGTVAPTTTLDVIGSVRFGTSTNLGDFYIFPTTGGASGTVLTDVNGDGNLSWETFSGVSGSIATGQVGYGDGSNNLTSDSSFLWDPALYRFSVGDLANDIGGPTLVLNGTSETFAIKYPDNGNLLSLDAGTSFFRLGDSHTSYLTIRNSGPSVAQGLMYDHDSGLGGAAITALQINPLIGRYQMGDLSSAYFGLDINSATRQSVIGDLDGTAGDTVFTVNDMTRTFSFDMDPDFSSHAVGAGFNISTSGFSYGRTSDDGDITRGFVFNNTNGLSITYSDLASPFTTALNYNPLTAVLTIDNDGTSCTLDPIGGNTCTSDERLKKNITDLDSHVLESLTKLRTVIYNWENNADTASHIGFLAQDMQAYYPELVATAPNGYLQVNYAGITPVLVQAIRELNLKISDIENFANAENQTFLNNLITWLGDRLNGLTSIHVDQEICIGATCINESELQQFKVWQTGGSSSSGSSSTPESDPESQPESEVSPGEEIISDSPEPNEPEIIVPESPVVEPEPAPEPESVPEPEVSTDPII